MRQSRPLYLVIIGIVVLFLAVTVAPSFAGLDLVAYAQDVPFAETTVPPPDTPTPTATSTATPTPTSTATAVDTPTATPTGTVPPTGTPTEVPPEPPAPVQIPEPITVVLFGTGLAALSAAAASRRKNDAE